MTIQLRRDTAANWASANPVLSSGQPAYDTTNNELRIGDGVATWSALTAIGGGVSDHGALTGLADDDHTQYHNNTRGDVRYYTKTLLDAGQLDTRYFTEAEVTTLLSGKFDEPVGDTTQYIAGDGSLITFPVAGQAGSLVRQVRNETGSTLTKGTVIYLLGASGNKPLAIKAIANSEAASDRTFGVIQANITNNANGYCVVSGDLGGLDTSALTEGAILYLSPTVAGGSTTTQPASPYHSVILGVVTRSHATQGQVDVSIQNGFELSDIHDVSLTAIATDDFLTWNGSRWVNTQLVAADVTDFSTAADARITAATGVSVQAYDADLTSLAAASATDSLYYRSAANTWSPVTIGANITFSGGTLSASGGGGSVTSGTSTVAFGATAANEAQLVVTGQAGILVGSIVTASIGTAATADYTGDDHKYLGVVGVHVTAGSVVAGTGFTIYVRSAHSLAGDISINWVY